MPRIVGIDIPEHKKVVFALAYLYGIGRATATDIVSKAKIDPAKRARDLTGEEINRIQALIEKYAVEGDLRRMISDNINRLKRVRAYRGLRHAMNLPVRGQRTRSNSRTKRSGRRTVGALTKEMAAKIDTAKTANKAAAK